MDEEAKQVCWQPTVQLQPEPVDIDDDEETVAELTRDAVLAADDLRLEPVRVPEWGGLLYVRSLTGTQRDEFEQACMDARRGNRLDVRGLKARLLVMTVCDGAGGLMFGPKDVEAIRAKSAAAIERVWDTAQRLNGLTAEAVEELAGN